MLGPRPFSSPFVGVAEARAEPLLLVSMRRDLRGRLRDDLSAIGFSVDVEASGVGGLRALRESDPAYGWLVCDFDMPGMIDGGHLAYEFRFQRPQRLALFLPGERACEGTLQGEFVAPEAAAIGAAITRIASAEIAVDGDRRLCFR